MQKPAISATDIDRQYLENIRNLRIKIAAVQHSQRESSRALELIRQRVRLVYAEMQRTRLHPQPAA